MIRVCMYFCICIIHIDIWLEVGEGGIKGYLCDFPDGTKSTDAENGSKGDFIGTKMRNVARRRFAEEGGLLFERLECLVVL